MLARSGGLTAVSAFLASLLDRKEHTVRQQLREWCYEAAAKRGVQRQALVVEACFGPLLRWVLHWWQGPQLAVALDATTLGDRFVVLAISVLYRGGTIPVAWTVLPATAKGAWKADWLRWRPHWQASVPATMTVLVLADRGRYARWLFPAIVHLGWHPLLRVNAGGLFRPSGRARWHGLPTFAPPAWHPLGGHRHGVQDRPLGWYLPGLLGSRPGRAVAAGHRPPARGQHRGLVSVFRRGWITSLVALLRQAPLPTGQLIPEPWPAPRGPLVVGRHHAF